MVNNATMSSSFYSHCLFLVIVPMLKSHFLTLKLQKSGFSDYFVYESGIRKERKRKKRITYKKKMRQTSPRYFLCANDISWEQRDDVGIPP